MFQKMVASFLVHLDRVGCVNFDNLAKETREVALWLLQRNKLKEESVKRRTSWGDEEVTLLSRR